MLFELFIVVVTGLGLLYWYLKDYANSGALKSVFVGVSRARRSVVAVNSLENAEQNSDGTRKVHSVVAQRIN